MADPAQLEAIRHMLAGAESGHRHFAYAPSGPISGGPDMVELLPQTRASDGRLLFNAARGKYGAEKPITKDFPGLWSKDEKEADAAAIDAIQNIIRARQETLGNVQADHKTWAYIVAQTWNKGLGVSRDVILEWKRDNPDAKSVSYDDLDPYFAKIYHQRKALNEPAGTLGHGMKAINHHYLLPAQ